MTVAVHTPDEDASVEAVKAAEVCAMMEEDPS
jgi:hypothetical protein